MYLPSGTRLGPYRIEAPIGAGGMGEVYCASDTRLNRNVAVKILPSHLTAEPSAKQRFEREAHIASALNDPHICTIYDVGEHEGPCVGGEASAQTRNSNRRRSPNCPR